MSGRRMTSDQKERLEYMKTRREAYRRAELAILSSQEYRNGTFSNRRAELVDIQKQMKALDDDIQALESGGKRYSFRVTPMDL